MTSRDGSSEIRTGFLSALVSLCASSSTLICCAIPALLVGIGAGATLASLVSIFPQIVWISEQKELVFGGSGLLVIISGVLQYRNQSAPCPADPQLRVACLQARKVSIQIYLASLGLLIIGSWFAFIQPIIR